MDEEPKWKSWGCEESKKVRYLKEILLEMAKSHQSTQNHREC